jgi:coproporphyrinogen III oxidase
LNIRYFEAGDTHWFGGGVDLTPFNPQEAKIIAYHRGLKHYSESRGRDYKANKAACDE